MKIQIEIVQNKTPPSLLLRDLVRNKVDLLKISDRLNVNPSTVRKILEGYTVSQSIIKKIEAAIQEGGVLDENRAGDGLQKPNHSTVERLMQVYHLYQQEKNLKLVGIRLGLTRERVRQLLKKGAEIGLFKYQPQKPPLLSREKILRDFGRFLKHKDVARANRISPKYLSKLMALYHLTKSDLEPVRREGRRRWYVKEYGVVAAGLGHHPSGTELVRSKSTRSLEFKIRREWGSLDAFRRELNVTPGMPVGDKILPASIPLIQTESSSLFYL